jgi:hypothetical protein
VISALQIIITFFCQRRLDDQSIAGLLQIPETTSIACCVLKRVWYRLHSNEAFSIAHGQTLKTLVALLHTDSATSSQRANTVEALSEVISLENDESILNLAETWKTLLLMDTQPAVQLASMYFVEGLVGEAAKKHRGVSELWEILVKILVFGTENQVRLAAGRTIRRGMSTSPHVKSKIASIPDVLKLLFNLLKSEAADSGIRLLAGELWFKLSQIVDERLASEDKWERAGKILEDVIDGTWYSDNNVFLRYAISCK